MKKVNKAIAISLLSLIVLFCLWLLLNILFGKMYKVEDIKLDQNGYNYIQANYSNLKLPQGVKIDKASVINGFDIVEVYVKILVPKDKITEFKSMCLLNLYEEKQVSESDLDSYAQTIKDIKWWRLNRSNADYKVIVNHGSKQIEFIFGKLEDGMVPVYIK